MLTYITDTLQFVERHFYVDDGLVSLPTEVEAISLFQRKQKSLSASNLRLHKVASNCQAVMDAFPPEDHAAGFKDMDLSGEKTLSQRSLGMQWEIETDTFTFAVATVVKPFTRRGVLSTVNSVYDPLGLVAPVTIQGRAILRNLVADKCGWDILLPEETLHEWEAWRDSLQDLKQLHVPRKYTCTSLSTAERMELCVFSDASIKAIGAVAYLRASYKDGRMDVGFVLGKAKLAPRSQPTIPRLELSAAVLAVEIAELICDELDLKLDAVKFYCDSKVVLGYIHNTAKRFYVYVHNRVQRIHQSTKPKQWSYIPSEDNPADHASRSVAASQLIHTTWLTGPAFLHHNVDNLSPQESFELVNPGDDAEIRPEVSSLVTKTDNRGLTTERFERFSTMTSLSRAIAFLMHVAKSFKSSNQGVALLSFTLHPR